MEPSWPSYINIQFVLSSADSVLILVSFVRPRGGRKPKKDSFSFLQSTSDPRRQAPRINRRNDCLRVLQRGCAMPCDI